MKRLFQLWQIWETRLYESKLVQMILLWAKTHSFPGFFKVSVYDVAVGLQNELRKYDLFIRANAVAYSFFLALFPSLIALFTLIPILKKTILHYLPEGEQFDMHLQAELQRLMPGVAGQRLFDFIEDITNHPRVALLSFGFLMAIYFASNGMLALMQGFDKSYPLTFVKRSPYAKRGIAILLTFILGLLLISSVILIILGDFLIHFFSDLVGLDWISSLLLSGLRWVIIFALFYFSIGIIYRMGAATRKKFRLFTPGASVATFLSIISSLVFSAYVNNFNTYNELYGSIGTIIILMLWIQINAFSLLIGFELNASIAVNRDERQHIFQPDSKT
ncbi:MAG: hypothetical protein KIPDCIKN_02614 [Haliscomenobacter sp.]|nr:hypothetical protein [Haliscomenobacter sp.]